MNRWLVLLVVGFVLLAIAGWFFVARYDGTGMIIGGERDAHGCLVAAGYVFDEDIGACIRPWDLDDDERIAAMAAANVVGFSDGLTVVSVESRDCEGCFEVTLDRYGAREYVTIEDWVVI